MAISFNEELIRVEFVIGEDTITETVTSEITVPDVKPDIERIVDVKADITDIETDIEDGGVNITGDIEPSIIYVAEVPEGEPQQPVHFVGGEEVAFQFTNFVDIPDAEPGMNVFTDLNIKRVSYNFDPNDPRTVEVTVVITKFVKVTEFRQITVITEITGIPEEDVTEELLRIDDVIGEKTVTTTVTGRIDVPDVKPPIERVLNARADILPVTTEITEDGVIIDSSIEVGVMYVADVPEGEPQQPVHFVEGTIPLNEALDIPGAIPDGMTVYTNLNVKRVSFDFIDEDEVEVDVVVEIFAKVTETRQVTVVVDVVSDLVEIERELLRVEDVVGEKVVFETITGRLNVPAGKPDIAEDGVIEASAQVLSYDDMTEREGVMIEGTVEGSIIYIADAEDQPVHFAEDTFNFDNFVEIPGTEEGMNIHSEVVVQRVSYNQLGPRTVEITAVLRKFVKVTEFKQIEIVTDLVVISPAVEDECPPSYVVYVVQKGDTLWKISRRYNTTVESILEANPNIDPNNLQVGQKICIPKGIIKPKG